jgi:hypothetical protein
MGLDCPQKVRHYLGVFLWKELGFFYNFKNYFKVASYFFSTSDQFITFIKALM